MASISSLHPVPLQLQKPSPISIKLNADIINQLKQCAASGTKAKLIVKDGQYLIKIDKSEFPCSALPETSRIDIYNGSVDSQLDYNFNGRILTRLNVLTDPKMIKEYLKRPQALAPAVLTAPSSSLHATPVPTPSSTPAPSIMVGSVLSSIALPVRRTNSTAPSHYYTSNEDIPMKFLYFSALGPATIKTLCQSLRLTEKEVATLLSQYSQIYNPNDSFIIDDIFSRNEAEPGSMPTYILKDKSYKELKPWNWAHYTDDERSLIIHNIHNALTRLGFLETHPLRRKLTEKRSESQEEEKEDSNGANKKASSLGGGLLKQRKVSPVKRSQTSSPRPPPLGSTASGTTNNSHAPSTSNGNSVLVGLNKNGDNSPLKERNYKRKLSISSASSSDDEKPIGSMNVSNKSGAGSGGSGNSNTKRRKTVGRGRTSSNSSTGSGGSSTSMNSIGQGADNYTSPSSINEELENEPSPPAATPQHASTPAPAASHLTSSTPLFAFQEPSKEQKKLQFYNNLALKFKVRYKEYEELYKALQVTTTMSTSSSTATMNGNTDKKRNITKLFELHNQLAEWKRKLWDFDNESKTKLKIMTLLKHKKSLSDGMGKSQSLSPSIPAHNLTGTVAAGTPARMKKRVEPKLPMKPTGFNRSLDY